MVDQKYGIKRGIRLITLKEEVKGERSERRIGQDCVQLIKKSSEREEYKKGRNFEFTRENELSSSRL